MKQKDIINGVIFAVIAIVFAVLAITQSSYFWILVVLVIIGIIVNFIVFKHCDKTSS